MTFLAKSITITTITINGFRFIITNIYENIYVPYNINIFHVVSHLIFTETSWDVLYYHLYFTQEETELTTHQGSCSSKLIELKWKTIWLQSPSSWPLTFHNFSVNMPDMAWAENNQPNWQAAYRPQLALEPCGNYDGTHNGLIIPPDTDHRSSRAHPCKGTPHITRGDLTRRADGERGELDGSLSSFLSFRKYNPAPTSSASYGGHWGKTVTGSAP